MPFSNEIVSKAQNKLDTSRLIHKKEQESIRNKVFQSIPETYRIDAELRKSVPQAFAKSLRSGANLAEEIQMIRNKNLQLQQELSSILTLHGLDPDILTEKPLCSKCNDHGWIGTTMCTCLQEQCAKEQIESLSSIIDLKGQTFETFRLDYYDTTFWPDFNRSPRDNMKVIFQKCREYAYPFGSSPVKNLIFSGSPGLGKTFLSACIAGCVSEQNYSVVYDSASTIFSRFEEKKFNRSETSISDTNKYLNCDLLILDDLGSELTTPFVLSALYDLINIRLIENKHTVISTNLVKSSIAKKYPPQIVSRLNGNYVTLPFFGQDIRPIIKSKSF